MRSPVLSALGLALAVDIVSGCNGSDNLPIVSSGPPVATTDDDQRIPQSDALTGAEVSLVNQANAEPAPPQKPDL